VKSLLKKSAFILANKPFVQKPRKLSPNRFPSGGRGGFVISADFELGWAYRYSKTEPYPREKARQTRNNFPSLIRASEELDIPITWATVGHLFLKNCHRGDHDWMHRVPYFENEYWSYRQGDWFDCDPYVSWEQAPEWYAPDLIEQILNSRVRHEIGCHTFSHMDFTDARCPRELAEDDMKACQAAAQDWGIRLETFVFPAGTYGNFEALSEYGFTAFRKSLDYNLGYPFLDQHDLVVIPASCGLEDNGLGWSPEYFAWRYKRYIDRAIRSRTLCHFWFHPSFDERFLRNVYPGILRYAAEKRDSGELWIGTMREMARHFRSGTR
jgi:peptidoglycan/xylan/chitin deacetylase (PgdA/CDA1 family)